MREPKILKSQRNAYVFISSVGFNTYIAYKFWLLKHDSFSVTDLCADGDYVGNSRPVKCKCNTVF